MDCSYSEAVNGGLTCHIFVLIPSQNLDFQHHKIVVFFMFIELW
jgi:hypothetical protein